MSEYKLFAQRVGLVGITNAIISLHGLILIPVLTKTLGASGYGTWAQIIVTISLITPIAMLGLPSAMVRFLAAEKDKKEIQEGVYSVLFAILFFGLIFSLLVYALSNPIAVTIIRDASATPLIKIASIIVLAGALDGATLQFFLTFGQMKKYSALTLLQTFGEVCLVALAVFYGSGLLGAVVSLLTSRIIVFLISFSLVISKIGFAIPTFTQIKSRLKPYLLFGLPMVPAVISAWVINMSDRYIIGYFMGSTPVGIYAAAYGVGSVILMFYSPISTVLYPTISKLWEDDKLEDVRTHLKYTFKYFLMIAIPSAFGLTVLARQILIILSTSEFVSSGVLVLSISAFSTVLYGGSSILGHVFVLIKKTKYIAYLLAIAAVTNIILNIILVPLIGILGAAIGTLFAFFMLFVCYFNSSHKFFKFNLDFPFVVKSIIASLIMSGFILKYNPVGTIDTLISIGLGGGIYLGLIVLMKGIKKDEFRVLKDSFK